MTYGARVSGPQLAVPTPRWAASMWTMVSARGRSSTSCAAASRSAAVEWVAETWPGRSRSTRIPPSGPRDPEPARVGVAAVLLRPDVGDELVGDGRPPPPDPPAPGSVRVRLVRPAPEPLERLVAGRELEHRADPREVVDLGRHLDRFLDADPAIAGEREPLGVSDLEARGRRPGRPDGDRVGGPLDPVEPARQRRQAPGRPAGRHPADPVVVGRGAPEGQGRRRRERGVEEVPLVVERDVAGPALMWCGARVPRAASVPRRPAAPAPSRSRGRPPPSRPPRP